MSVMALPELSVAGLVETASVLIIVCGGVFPFLFQYRDIRRSQNAEGFSTFVCFTLLTANILRLLFWFGKPFEIPLVVQSVIMIVTMLTLVQFCVEVNRKSQSDKTRQLHFKDLQLGNFWQWTDFTSYLQFCAMFTLVIGLMTYMFLDSWIYIETLGFLALFIEAMLGAPQFVRNFQNKSTQGMSRAMVGMWTSGDVFKTCYFVLRKAPAQFWICGLIQVLIDILIFIQVFMYRKRKLKER